MSLSKTLCKIMSELFVVTLFFLKKILAKYPSYSKETIYVVQLEAWKQTI